MQIIGHRGACYDAPENTLVSVNMGWESRAEIVEIDIHLSRDGRIMVIHDASTLRTTGVDLKVSETDSVELRKLDAGSHKGLRFAGERIPFLEEVLATVPPGRGLFVEIKCGQEVLPVLRDVLEASGKASQVTLIGFGLETMVAAKQMMPEFPNYWLRMTERDKSDGSWVPYGPSLIREAAVVGLDGLDLHYAGLTDCFVQAAKAAGQNVYAWTVNDPAEARRLRDMGVDALGTDRPRWMIEQLGS